MNSNPTPSFRPSGPLRRIVAVVLNYRTPDLTIQAAHSVAADLSPGEDRVVVVDNHSPDDSLEKLRAGLDLHKYPHIELVASPDNGGFAAGNNVGILAVSAQAYLLLNSDTIVRQGATKQLLSTLQKSPEVGIASPRLQFEDDQAQISCFRHHSLMSELISGAQTGPVTRLLKRWDVPLGVQETEAPVPWTSFACVLIRREVFEKVGLLDEGFFMYYEDADYCRQVNASGFRIVHNPAAQVVHLRGKSSPVKEAGRLGKARPGYFYAARARYFRRAYGPWGAALANIMWTTGRAIALPREILGNKKPHTVDREFYDKWRDTFDQGPRRP